MNLIIWLFTHLGKFQANNDDAAWIIGNLAYYESNDRRAIGVDGSIYYHILWSSDPEDESVMFVFKDMLRRQQHEQL